MFSLIVKPKSKRAYLPVPGPTKGVFSSFASLLQLRRHPLDFMSKAAKDYGDIVKLGDLTPTYLFVHPDGVKEILQLQHQKVKQGRGHRILKLVLGEGLLTSDGERHHKDRRAIQPEFHRKRIAAYAKVMTEKSQEYISYWEDGEEIEVSQEMKKLTLAIVAKTLFGTELKTDIREMKAADTALHKGVIEQTLHPLGPILYYLPLPASLRFRRSIAAFDRIIYRLIVARQASETEEEDLISMLLSLEGAKDAKGQQEQQALTKKVRDQALTFFLAGHETTANALSWTCYLLAKNPQVEAKMYTEIKAVLQGRPALFEDIPQLQYTAKVFKEALRLYPPAWAVGRTAIADFKIGPYLMSKNCECIVSPYITQRDPRWFPKAEQFIPERWTDAFEKELPRCAYFPFGAGPRQCIGEGFAKIEASIILANIFQKWKLHLDPNYRAEMDTGITLSPKGGLPVHLEKR